MPQQQLNRFRPSSSGALGHPVRLRMLELLRNGEQSVSELQAELEIEASSVSQQLAVLRAKNIVEARRAGTSVYYSVRDPQVAQLLDVARDIFNNHLIDLQSMLDGARRAREAVMSSTAALVLLTVGPRCTCSALSPRCSVGAPGGRAHRRRGCRLVAASSGIAMAVAVLLGGPGYAAALDGPLPA